MKKIIVIMACAVCACQAAFAQTQATLRIGWIETADLLAAMPERVKADSDMMRYGRSFQEQIDIMIKEYQTKLKEYQANEKTMDDPMKEVKGKELQDLQNRIESTQQSAQEKVQQKKEDIYKPIFDKATKAIQEIAKEKGYDYIFDKSGTMLYGRESDNIMTMVKGKMGIK